jgi:hypothetical protein
MDSTVAGAPHARPSLRVGAWLLAALVGIGAAAPARAQDERPAPDSEACFSAAEQAQPLMKQRKLHAAQRQLEVCAHEACPKAARTDCRGWLADVTRAQPTVLFVAREERPSGASRAVDDVRVSVDGELLVQARLEPNPIVLDPGVHVLTFEHAGFDPVEQRIDVREGERNREIDVVFRSMAGGPRALAAPPPPAAPPSPPMSAAAEVLTTRPVPVTVYAFAGMAVVALGVGVVMESLGLSDRAHLVDTCKPTRSCDPSDVDAARGRVLAGDIALGVSALLFAGSATFYFTRETQPLASARAIRFRLGPLAAGVFAGVEGSL